MRFMVDAGATAVTIGRAQADRQGLPYRQGRAVQMSTANGTAQGWMLRLPGVRLGDVRVHEVDAVVMVILTATPAVPLGDSLPNRWRMRRDGSQMTLVRR